MLRTLLILLFGAVPATLLSILALYLVAIGFSFIDRGHVASGLANIAYGVGAITGTIALWFSAYRMPSAQIKLGILIGLLTAAPWLPVLFSGGETVRGAERFIWSMLIGSPIAVATLILGQAIWATYAKRK